MNTEQYPSHGVKRPRGWRVLTRFQVFLLWCGGFLLGSGLSLIAWGLSDGKPLVRMISPILGSVVAMGFVVQALYWSPRPEDYESEES